MTLSFAFWFIIVNFCLFYLAMESSHSVRHECEFHNYMYINTYRYIQIIYFSIVYLHRDAISTKELLQLISSLYDDIIRMKEKERKRREKDGAFNVFHFFYTGEG